MLTDEYAGPFFYNFIMNLTAKVSCEPEGFVLEYLRSKIFAYVIGS
jgi:hypothetical protein